MLDVLGIDADEEALYDHLMRWPAGTPDELRVALPDLAGRVDATLGSLAAKGLVRGPDETGAYAAIPPDLALRGLAAQFEHRLDRARARIGTLADVYAAAPRPARDLPVEMVPGDEAIGRFRLLSMSAKTELRVFETPPYSDTGDDDPEDYAPWPPEMDGLARGVRVRAIYGRAAMEQQTPSQLREPILAGEEARAIDEVPLRLLLVDRELAMLPARTGQPLNEGMLVVRQGALLDGLSSLFEAVWAQALPLTISAEPEPASNDETLVALLAAGLGDQAVARHLGVGLRTVQRRIQELMQSLHAATRFQAGVAIGRAERPVAAE
ncbi:hypothetical protein ALI144C_07255 [Actinosynnema sp. ALI-1.44]|uniref:hypothetical protein n=1 Tax=Actinosynnema sp. ALI-1.44 TaxID=1933779 RepID=UPI00097BF855|nr:hypothetical protein [Actinosynnema sp. ALI-1.44]ONI88239.1 hypothetical protein ALI144C_07255 [Actinosynnema sp. ALI-1.44]